MDSDLEVSNRARNPSDIGYVVVQFEFQRSEHEMCIIIQGKEDIYADGIAITHTSLNRA
jgi:hypothetical protein